MAARRNPHGTLEKPQTRADVIAWLAAGHSHASVAALLAERKISVSRQAITGFAHRHAAEVDALNQKAVAQIEEAAITQKADRIRRRQWYLDQLEGVMRDRGPLAREPKWIGSGDYGREVEVERVDTPLYRTASDILNDVARELGELPRPTDGIQSLHFTQINVQYNEGESAGDADREPTIID